MNKFRRQELREAIEALSSVSDIINEVLSEEQDSFDNLPESFQYSERGEKMEDNISDMENAVSNIDDIIELLEEVIDR